MARAMVWDGMRTGSWERATVRAARHGSEHQYGRQKQAKHGGEGAGDAQETLPHTQGYVAHADVALRPGRVLLLR